MGYHITDKYLSGLSGIEIGPGAHNDYGLKDVVNVGLDIDLFRNEEVNVCGTFKELDVLAHGDDLPFEDESYDYVFSSHVIEHMPNLWKAINEWIRVIKPDGYIIIVCPQRNALADDAVLPLTEWSHIKKDYENNETVDTHPGNKYGHYHIFTSETLKKFINKISNGRIWLQEIEDPDTKCGNGFTLVYKKENR